MPDEPFVLAADHAAFIGGDTASIAVSARDAALRPSIAKAVGCRVSDDRRRLTILVDQQVAADVVRDLRAGSPIAAVFSEPASHRTLQLKGAGAEVTALTPAEREHVRQHIDALVAHIVPLGYGADALRCYFGYAPEQLVGLAFAPVAAFEQTPGPAAGRPLLR